MRTNRVAYFMPLIACLSILFTIGCKVDNVEAPLAQSEMSLRGDLRKLNESDIPASQVLTTRTDGNIIVSGGGTGIEAGEKSTFTFNAVKKSDGTTTGHLVYNFRSGDNIIELDIDCIRLLSDNIAELGGVCTKAVGNVPFYIKPGVRARFTVVDNGEGNAVNPDLFSDVIFDYPVNFSTCASSAPFPYIAVSGNIQVKP